MEFKNLATDDSPEHGKLRYYHVFPLLQMSYEKLISTIKKFEQIFFYVHNIKLIIFINLIINIKTTFK